MQQWMSYTFVGYMQFRQIPAKKQVTYIKSYQKEGKKKNHILL